ncbi:MAG: oxidoreductase [Bacteroidetes bacterium]|nr:oxidoreductase [Bacteroidota bacterium]MBS1541844.1 oxidoreductase [Bacteroidota bacterium]
MKYFIAIISITFFSSLLQAQDYTWKNIPVNVKSSFRALSVVNDHVAWVSGSKGWIGRTQNGGKSWTFRQVSNFESLDFRSLYAFDSLRCIAANAGSPAYIFLTTDGGKNWKAVYQNDHKEAFIDGLDFWNNEKGIAYGDPLQGKMLLIATHDGGTTWADLAENLRPELKPGEASFAASGTGIRCYDKKKVTITTGGKVSRLWTSHDNGTTWSVAELPLLQNVETGGAFSSAFWGKRGVVVGGDFKNEAQTGKHIFCTDDRAKSWVLPLRPTRGLRECVEYLGKDNLIAIGPQGCDTTNDGGYNWYALSDEPGFHVVRQARQGKLIVAAGNGKIAVIAQK